MTTKTTLTTAFNPWLLLQASLIPEKFPVIYDILRTKEYASPYMEKYVCEALFQMGYGAYGLERLKKRFSKMVNDTASTTLYEGWGIGPEGFGGGSSNHAWSGGGLTILSQYVCGLSPLTPAWKTFQVKPALSGLTYAETGNLTPAGEIHVKVEERATTYALDVRVSCWYFCNHLHPGKIQDYQ